MMMLVFLIVVLIILVILNTTDNNNNNNIPSNVSETVSETDGNVALLIHTFDGYRRYWQGSIHFTQQHSTVFPTYFANENRQVSLPESWTQLRCGKGAFGYRLRRALEQILEPYVVYIQEDMWLQQDIPSDLLQRATRKMEHDNLVSIKLFHGCQHDIHETDLNNPRWYIGTHQPSLWNREFLLNTIQDSMTPFQHEVRLNQRLHRNRHESNRVSCVDDLSLPPLKYVDVSRRGKLRDIGKKMLKRANLPFRIDHDEIMDRTSV